MIDDSNSFGILNEEKQDFEILKDIKLNKDSLNKRIHFIELFNVQGHRHTVYELPQNGIVRLDANNGQGKSNLKNALRAVCTSEFKYNDSIREIVSGELHCYDNKKLPVEEQQKFQCLIRLSLYNGNVIETYIGFWTGYIFYKYLGENDYDKKVWQTSIPPQEILNELGWLIIEEDGFCVNLRDNDNLFPVKTPSRIVNEVLKKYLVDYRMEKLIQDTKENREYAQKICFNCEQALKFESQFIFSGNEVDIEKMEKKLNILSNYRKCLSDFVELKSCFDKISDLSYSLKDNPKSLQKDKELNDLNGLLLLVDYLNNIIELNFKLKEMPKDIKNMSEEIKILNEINFLNSCLSKIYQLYNCISEVKNLKDLSNEIEFLFKIFEILNNLEKISKLSNKIKIYKDINEENLFYLNLTFEFNQFLQKIYLKTLEIQKNKNIEKEKKNQLKEISKNIEKCDKCGQLIFEYKCKN